MCCNGMEKKYPCTMIWYLEVQSLCCLLPCDIFSFFYPVSDNFFFCAVWLPFGFTTIHFDIKFCKTPHHSSMCGRETVPSELSARMFITDAYNKLQGHVNHLLMKNRKRRPDHWEEDKRKALKVSGNKRPIIFCHFLKNSATAWCGFHWRRDAGQRLEPPRPRRLSNQATHCLYTFLLSRTFIFPNFFSRWFHHHTILGMALN
jgi:hypothetical protein